MNGADVIVVLLAGLVVGSFLNVLIARFEDLSSIITGRSHCPHCKKTIAWYDLIPILSYIFLIGRCRHCCKPISSQYPIVEALSAIIALHLYWVFGPHWVTLAYYIVFALLLVIAVIDLQESLIPDSYSLPAILVAFGIVAFTGTAVAEAMWAVLIAGGSLAALVVSSREQWMGMGDITLGIILGLLAGLLGSLVGLAIAFIGGAVVSLLLMLYRRKRLTDMIPFGPFLVVAIYLATIWGNSWANAYLTAIHWM